MSADPGLDFWLDYVDHHGGAFERTGDGALVVLPRELAARHGQEEEFLVTSEPEVSDEVGATLLSAGHPLLTMAAEAVLAQGDHGCRWLPRPVGRVPDGVALLDHARGRFPVDHGRIDLTGGPRPAVRQVLRVGALVTFELSADDQFQEPIECWMDVAERLPLPSADALALVALLAEVPAARDEPTVESAVLSMAVSAADEEIRRQAQDRRQLLSQQVDASRIAELTRAGDYYREMINSLTRRKLHAAHRDAAKEAVYLARICSAEAERDRRLAEINDKYRGSVTVLPFRLQLIGVPVLRLDVDVRRGDRRYPLELDWLVPTRSFAAIRCPRCGSSTELVAGKSALGCRRCLPRTPEPTSPPERPAGSERPAAPPPVGAAPGRPVATRPPTGAGFAAGPGTAVPPAEPPLPHQSPAAPRHPHPVQPLRRNSSDRRPAPTSPAQLAKLESRLVTSFWQQVESDDRSVRKILGSDSPAAALLHFFGVGGLRRAVGLRDGPHNQEVGWSEGSSIPGSGLRLTAGFVRGPGRRICSFQLCWHLDQGRPLLDEITPNAPYWPRLPEAGDRQLGAARGLFAPPHLWPGPSAPVAADAARHDEVTDILTSATAANRGLPLVARCVSSWWRVPDRARLIRAHRAEVLAASLERMISYRAGSDRAHYAEVASDHGVSVTDMKTASAVLQRHLMLSATLPW